MSDTVLPYSTNTVETNTVENFLSDEHIKKLIIFYDTATQSLSDLTGKKVRIPELTFAPDYPPEALEYITFDSNEACGLGEYIDLESGSELYTNFINSMPLGFNSIDKSFIEEIEDVIKNNLKSNGYDNFKFTKISLQNLNEYNHVTQCKGNPPKKIEKILAKPEKHIQAFQGTVSLELDNDKYSSVIFDQWFPWSTYYMPNYTSENTPWKKRVDMTFLKEDSPEKFNETIRKHTGKEFSEYDWVNINENWITECDWHSFDKQQFYGLSLEKVLPFGNPGTLNLWDMKKYYISMPWNAEFKTRRLTLNFETKNT